MSISSSTIDANFLPNLPGYKPRVLPSAQKKHYFGIVEGGTFLKDDESFLPSLSGSAAADFADDFSVTSIGNTTATRAKRKANMNSDRVTLTFKAYFEEDPVANSAGAKQVRQSIIFFFTEDGSLRVVEKAQLNSGVSQGTLVRRSVIAKEDGNPITEYDMIMGQSLKIYGRVYT